MTFEPFPSPPSHSGDKCRYRYTQQPPRSLQCDPYAAGRLVTRCEVIFDPSEEAVEIRWVFVPSNNTDTISILSSSTGSKYVITPSTFAVEDSASIILSELRVEALSDADSGAYYCQIRFQNGSLAEQSRQLDLSPSQSFAEQQLSPCSRIVPQAVREELCALTGSVDAVQGGTPGGSAIAGNSIS